MGKDSTTGTIITSPSTRSLLFQFSSSAISQLHAAILLGIEHYPTGQIFYRLILIDFHSDQLSNSNYTRYRHMPDELRLSMSTMMTSRNPSFSIASSSFDVDSKILSYQIVLIVLIIFLAIVCLSMIVTIVYLCYQRQRQRKQQQEEEEEDDDNDNDNREHNKKPIQEVLTKTFPLQARSSSSLSMIEKFHAPDLTTKVTLLTHFHLADSDFGTDV
jgi:hypothetical protein